MAATVYVFFHSGLSTAHVAAGTRYATDSVGLLKQPYIGRDDVNATSASATSSSAAPAGTKIAYVQVQEGKTVHYECNPENRSVDADTTSPFISGSTTFECGPGWTFSFFERV